MKSAWIGLNIVDRASSNSLGLLPQSASVTPSCFRCQRTALTVLAPSITDIACVQASASSRSNSSKSTGEYLRTLKTETSAESNSQRAGTNLGVHR